MWRNWTEVYLHKDRRLSRKETFDSPTDKLLSCKSQSVACKNPVGTIWVPLPSLCYDAPATMLRHSQKDFHLALFVLALCPFSPHRATPYPRLKQVASCYDYAEFCWTAAAKYPSERANEQLMHLAAAFNCIQLHVFGRCCSNAACLHASDHKWAVTRSTAGHEPQYKLPCTNCKMHRAKFSCKNERETKKMLQSMFVLLGCFLMCEGYVRLWSVWGWVCLCSVTARVSCLDFDSTWSKNLIKPGWSSKYPMILSSVIHSCSLHWDACAELGSGTTRGRKSEGTSTENRVMKMIGADWSRDEDGISKERKIKINNDQSW